MPTMREQPFDQRPSAEGSRARVLLLEDDSEMRSLLAEVLRAEGYLVDVFPDGMSWLNSVLGTSDCREVVNRWEVIVSDVRMPGLSGLSVLGITKLQCGGRLPSLIIITAFGDEETYAEARRLGAAAVLDKPFEIDDLVTKVWEIVPP